MIVFACEREVCDNVMLTERNQRCEDDDREHDCATGAFQPIQKQRNAVALQT